ncbi:MAG: metallophosphoesterase [Sporomusaceae bacterium]|nr:metallophosphoesterase [Sporomusaceae bacterium]
MKKGVMLFYGFYALAHIYIGFRLTGLLKLSALGTGLLWATLFLLFFAFLLGRKISSSAKLANIFLKTGAYWFGISYYLVLFLLLGEALLFLHRRHPFLPPVFLATPRLSALFLFCLLSLILLWGAYQARTVKIRSYKLAIAKPAGSLTSLHIAFAADLHLGSIITKKDLQRFVKSLETLQPDLILLAGDIIDGDAFTCRPMLPLLKKLQAPYGIYAVLGNHEYLNGQVQEITALLTQAGIRVLRDEIVILANNLVLAGRDDNTSKTFTGKDRLSLNSLLTKADRRLPILLLDHQPIELDKARTEGVDLHLSGHTHYGQLFPNSLITGKVFEVDWGYRQKETLQILVTCGFGTWGPPLRIGSQSEIIDLTITFADPIIP